MSTENLHILFTTPSTFAILGICAVLIGMSKMGFPGINIVVNPILIYHSDVHLAIVIALILLYVGDITAIINYRKTFDKKIYIRFIPWALVGVLISGVVGKFLDKKTFVLIMTNIILFFAVLMVVQQIMRITRGSKKTSNSCMKKLRTKKLTNDIFFGTLSGIASMLANSSGPLTSMYLLKLNISKKQFIGSGAFLYFTYNSAKLFVVFFLWQTLTLPVLLYTLTLIPFSVMGAYLAKFLSHYLSENIYRWVILLLVVFAAISMIVVYI